MKDSLRRYEAHLRTFVHLVKIGWQRQRSDRQRERERASETPAAESHTRTHSHDRHQHTDTHDLNTCLYECMSAIENESEGEREG